jgi:hypothetical protein
MNGSGLFWELHVREHGELVSVRDGKRTILLMPKLQKTDIKSWALHSVIVGQGENFSIEIIPESCGDYENRYEGSGKIWIKFKDPSRKPLFGCAFLQRQSRDYTTVAYPTTR